MSPNQKLFIIAGILSITQSCALKETPQELAAQALHKMDGRLLSFTLKWEGQSQLITIDGPAFAQQKERDWSHANVISLPVRVPESAPIEIRTARTPQEVKDLEVIAAATTGENLNERLLGVEHLESLPEEIGTVIKFNLLGLPTLFRENREQRIYLTVRLKSNQGDFAKLALILSTPPSRLSITEQELVLNREARNEKGITGYRKLTSQAQTRELIERIQLRNDSFEKIRFSIPFKTHAEIHMKGRRYWSEVIPNSNLHVPQYGQKDQEEIHDFESDFYIFPLREDLPTSWTGFAQKDLDTLYLMPGKTMDLGIYADGLATAQMRQFPTSHTSLEQKTVDGIAHCLPQYVQIIPQMGPPYCENFAEGRPFGFFPPETVAVCKEAIATMDTCIKLGFADKHWCNRAALIDDMLDRMRRPIPGTNILWHIWFGCRTWVPTPDGQHAEKWIPMWTWEPVYGNLRAGIETEPVRVEWENQNILIQARFSPGTGEAASESRSLVLIPDNLMIRE